MSLEEHVKRYLGSRGNKRVCAGPPPRLLEYNKLKFFWTNFGLNKYDLEKVDPRWVDEMFVVGIAAESAKYEAVNAQQNQTQNSVVANKFKVAKRTKIL